MTPPVAVLGSDDVAVTVAGEFSMSMWVEIGQQDGFVAGNPGRASLSIENGEFVFTIGGNDEIAGILPRVLRGWRLRHPTQAGPTSPRHWPPTGP